jgi:DNA-binding NarL/FixJ family response regulator
VVKVTVLDPYEPVFAVGLVEVLRAEGHDAVLSEQSTIGPASGDDIMILGVGDDDAPDAAAAAARHDVPVLLLCQCVDPEIVRLAGQGGLAGAVSRRSGRSAVCAAVVAAAAGHFVLPADVAPLATAGPAPPRQLTDTEEMLLVAVATSNIDEAADRLGYSRRHTQRLVRRMLADLDLPDTRSAVLAAGAWSLVPVPHQGRGVGRGARADSREPGGGDHSSRTAERSTPATS